MGVEHLVTEDKDRAVPCLLSASRGLEIRPIDIAPQYAGHTSPGKRSSANACSALGSSFLTSAASRVCCQCSTCSRSAIWITWLREAKRRCATHWSMSRNNRDSTVTATFAMLIGFTSSILVYHTIGFRQETFPLEGHAVRMFRV